MLCGVCLQREPKRKHGRARGRGRKRDQLCARCGQLLGPEALVRQARAKQSQLARFGLSGPHAALLVRKPRKDR